MMGAIAAAVSKTGENVVPKIAIMLTALLHRGFDYHGIATFNSIIRAKSIKKMEIEKLDSIVALGHNLSRILLRDHPQPLQGEGFSFVFEGRLFPSSSRPEANVIMEKLKHTPQKNAQQIIKRVNGSYVFTIACPDRVIVGRDTLGTNPLYYGENETTCAVASERKALWTLGIKNVKSFPPGNIAIINEYGFSFTSVKPVTYPIIKTVKMENAVKNLKNLLVKSTKERLADLEKVAVAFSGGLDSSIIAMLAKICGVKVDLISVGLKGLFDVQHVKVAAEALELPLQFQTYTLDDVKEVLPKVLWLIEEPDVIKVSVAIPFYWIAATASKLGDNILLAGQGSDELFGGYQRYLRKYMQQDSTLQGSMYKDIILNYENNLQRDNQICSFHKVELRLPFMDHDVVNFSLSLPVNLKIKSAEDNLRKRVLRQVAQRLGLPHFIVNRVKKSIQYETGVDRTLRKLARNKDLTLKTHVKNVFRDVLSVKLKFD